MHCGSIRQTASILSMSEDCLRTGDKALVHFRFIKHPEYIKPGQRMVFREGRTKAVGNVLRLIPHSGNANVQPSKSKKTSNNKQQQGSRSSNASGQAQDSEGSHSMQSQQAKRENTTQQMSASKKGRSKNAARVNIVQPLSEQNPPSNA